MTAFPRMTQAGEGRAAAVEFGIPEHAREVIARRGERTKRFRLPAGSFAEVASGRQLHYLEDGARWRQIAVSFRADGADRVAERLPFTVRTTGDGVAIGSRDEAAAVVFLSAARPTLDGERITFAIPGDDLAWHWQARPAELKLISDPIARRQGQALYVFPIRREGGFAPFVLNERGELESGRFIFARPLLLGADGETYEGVSAWQSWRRGDTLRLEVDDTALPPEAFPYRIDPPISELAAAADSVTWSPFSAAALGWDDPHRALTNNNAKAKAMDLAPEPNASVTQGLYLYDFGFQLDAQAVVTGVSVTLDREIMGCGGCNASDCVVDDRLYLTVDGQSVVGNNMAQPGCWPSSSNQEVTVGGEQEDWGTGLTPAEVTGADFGVVFSARGAGASGSNYPDAGVDFLSITIYWRQPDLPAGQIYPTDDTFLRQVAANSAQGEETRK